MAIIDLRTDKNDNRQYTAVSLLKLINQQAEFCLHTLLKIQTTDITLQSTTLRALGERLCVFRWVREYARTWSKPSLKIDIVVGYFSLNLKHSALFCRIDYDEEGRKTWIIDFSVLRCAVFSLLIVSNPWDVRETQIPSQFSTYLHIIFAFFSLIQIAHSILCIPMPYHL